MIISRAPFRVSFFGGGTDYPAWYREHGGAVLSTSINKYCYITCRRLPPFFEHRSRIVWSRIELIKEHSEIQHPVVREALAFLKLSSGSELHHDGDLPARSGIGSSSSFTVGLLHGLYALRGEMIGKMQLARDAIYREKERLREHARCQDQVLAAFGGFRRVEFFRDGDFQVTQVVGRPERLSEFESHLMLFFSGFSRNASDIAREQIAVTGQQVRTLERLYAMVDEAVQLIAGSDDLVEFGRLLHEGWQLKRGLTRLISTPEIDGIYEEARAAGAVGGKLLGAGGGGFMLLFVRPEDQPAVRYRLQRLLEVPVKFEQSGSVIVFYEPETAR